MMIDNKQADVDKKVFTLFTFLSTSFLLFLLYTIDSNYTFDSSDGVWHFLIAKYSYWNPELELDLWGKPVFTMIAAPFTQFGLKGMAFMQIISVILINFLLYHIANIFQFRHKWSIPLLLTFTPILFPEIFSGLTEILFSLFLLAGIYFVLKDDFLYAAVLFSILPFVRQEGYFIFPIFIILLLIEKKYLYIPFLFTGFILITLYGYPTFQSPFWLFSNNPYSYSNSLYEHGSFYFYINALEEVLGALRYWMLLSGIVLLLYTIIRKKMFSLTAIKNNLLLSRFVFLVPGYCVVFLLAESTFWGLGIFGGLGLHRLFVCIIPLFVLIILYGLHTLSDITGFLNLKKVLPAALCVCVIFLINEPFKRFYWPLELKGEAEVVSRAGHWLKEYTTEKRKIIYSHPYVIIASSLNPYNSNEAAELFIIEDKTVPEKSINPGEIVIWDAHFSPNECKLPLTNLLSNNKFKLLQKFVPAEKFLVNNKEPFEVYIFERLE